MPRTVLVTGGRGHIGRLLVDRLRAAGVRAISLGRSPAVHFDDVVVDLSEATAVAGVIADARPDVVVHLAAMLRGEDLIDRNALMDRAVAQAVRAANVPHSVFVSSAAVYGTAHATACREDSVAAPENPYGVSKLRGEAIFQQMSADRAEASVLTLRIFNVVGPDFPGSLVSRLIGASEAEPVTLVGPDAFVRDYVHQSDVVALLVASLTASHAGYRVLNAGAGVAVSTRDLIQRLAVPSSSYVERSGGPSVCWADMTRADQVLGVTVQRFPTRGWAAPILASPGSRSVAPSDERIG
ncbi:NAD-dependent epimerase/dehydratase family protein [Microbacterium terrisoli]|uniref:NAD-dependent epimerase/dehydratase family protein n=1 Tax=Microbacterium terrisoli TaxID=3242192 RepID=UPI002803F6D0|nr:NAD-dependent epimerase/dehydratase family protein [Microbacterium protaetiae]